MGYEPAAYDSDTIGVETMTSEIIIGSLAMSKPSADFVNTLVDGDDDTDLVCKPFQSIVEVFRFAFSVGFHHNYSIKREGTPVTVAPRFFVSKDYYDILQQKAIQENKSLGQLISDYAEGGIALMKKAQSESSILNLIDQ